MKLSFLNKQNVCRVCFSSLRPMKVPVHKITFMYLADVLYRDTQCSCGIPHCDWWL